MNSEANRHALRMGAEMDEAFDAAMVGKIFPASGTVTFYVEQTADGASVLGLAASANLTVPVIDALDVYLQERKAAMT